MASLELALVKAFGWSLWDIDNTSVESLLPVLAKITSGSKSGATAKSKKVFCDQAGAGWLNAL